MSIIKSAEFVKSSSSISQCPLDRKPEYAFIGRSNVGKSSLINMLTNRNKLAKISSRPGKTQLINHFLIDDNWYLVDLPGYGWAKVSKSDQYLKERETLMNVFLLIDSRHEPQKNDLEFMAWLGEQGLPFSLIFTKIDKQGKTVLQKNIALYKRTLKQSWEELPPIFLVSNVNAIGGPEILDYIQSVNRSLKS
jgi:GTP-binding protein